MPLPWNEEAEKAVLGAMLLSPQAIDVAAEKLTANDFYLPTYARIFSAIIDLWREGKEVDPITVSSEIGDEKLKPIGGTSGLIGLADSAYTINGINDYCEIVKDARMRRDIVRAAQTMQALAEKEEATTLLDKAERLLFDISRQTQREEWSTIAEVADEEVRRYQRANQGEVTIWHRTHLFSLNDIIGGLSPGNLIIIAARPSVGKTALALNIATHIARELPVVFFSLEMTKGELVQRIISSEGDIPLTHIRCGTIPERDLDIFYRTVERVKQLNIVIDDSPSTTVARMNSIIRRVASRWESIGLIAVDYLQLMDYDSTRTDSRNYEIAKTCRMLKQMAREYDAPVLALSQLSRPAKGEREHKPRLSDLRDSGAIEQDADVVLFLHRKEERQRDVQLIVGKNRNGPIGEVDVRFVAECVKFEEVV